MKLRELIEAIKEHIKEIKGSQDIEILGLCSNSKECTPHVLFIAEGNGSLNINEAIQGGAKAVILDFFNPFLPKQITQIVVEAPKNVISKLACYFYKDPSRKLNLIGITGTSGKTSTTFILRHLSFEERCAVIGSNGFWLGERYLPLSYTTPPSIELNKLLSEAVKQAYPLAAIEVSSHGLHQGRSDGLLFKVAIFTNLSQDHLDYHKTMEEYKTVKGRLFEMCEGGFSVINIDDVASEEMIRRNRGQLVTYSIEKKSDFQATDIQVTFQGSYFTLLHKDKKYQAFIPLLGLHNISNTLAAIASLVSIGYSIEELIEKGRTIPPIPGRFELISHKHSFQVVVDHAHKPDALLKMLKTLRSVGAGRIITIFGCGGDKDREKRPIMGQIAEEYSDEIILTHDNPRTEDPKAIIEEILIGFKKKKPRIIEDRKEAIHQAFLLAKPEDVVLIAGRGAEKEQKFKTYIRPFDDRLVAQKLLDEL